MSKVLVPKSGEISQNQIISIVFKGMSRLDTKRASHRAFHSDILTARVILSRRLRSHTQVGHFICDTNQVVTCNGWFIDMSCSKCPSFFPEPAQVGSTSDMPGRSPKPSPYFGPSDTVVYRSTMLWNYVSCVLVS